MRQSSIGPVERQTPLQGVYKGSGDFLGFTGLKDSRPPDALFLKPVLEKFG
jgi:hypothetical protein